MGKKVLVTGASGLIGRELCRQLYNKNYYVVAIDNSFRYNFKPMCHEYYSNNITEVLLNIKNDFEYIFHLGNINGTKYFYDIPTQLIENNISADFSVFNFVKQNLKCKLIYASSSEVVAGTTHFPTIEEIDVNIKDIHNPRWSYRLPKILGENYLKNSNFNFLVVRFFNVYSEYSGSGHFVKDITDKLKEKNYEIISPNETRSFCYVSDAVEAIICLKDISNEIVNVGSDEEIKIVNAANIIANALGISNVKWTVKDSRPGSVNRRVPDITVLKRHYPSYNPKKFSEVISWLAPML